MFLGQYIHTVDAKGRTFVPAKYRDALGECFVLTRGTSKCLVIYPMAEWERYVAKLNSLPQTQAAKLRRFLFSAASDLTADAQGRILLPKPLRDYAALGKSIVFLGLGSYVEIWAEEAWQAENETLDGAATEELMLSLGI